MTPRFPSTNATHQSDRLGFAIVLAIILHAMIIFGVGFKFSLDQRSAPTLEVTLAQHRADKAPDDADFLAQHSQLGSGEAREKEEITTDRLSELEGSRIQEAQPIVTPQQPAHREAQAHELVKTMSSSVLRTTPERDPSPDSPSDGQSQLLPTPLDEIASLRARLDDKKQEYSRMPRVLVLTSASARQADQAAYLRNWIETVEDIGNKNYPERARRQKIFGNLRLAVVVRPDGSVESVEVKQSSGFSILDQAAIRTVRLAAPFQSFPAEMQQWDKIEIIRTWQYVPGSQLLTE